jgi:hypothetical protein
MKYYRWFLPFILVFNLVLVGCIQGSKSALVDTWQRTTTPKNTDFSFFSVAERIEFLKDGTFVVPSLDNASGSYSFPEKGRIKLEGSYGSAVYNFTQSKNTLIFEVDGEMVEYKRN